MLLSFRNKGKETGRLLFFRNKGKEKVFRKGNTKGNYWRGMKRGRWRDMVSDIRRGRTYGKGEIDSKRY